MTPGEPDDRTLAAHALAGSRHKQGNVVIGNSQSGGQALLVVSDAQFNGRQGASVSGTLQMDGPIQIQVCQGCGDIEDPGRIWLDTSFGETEINQ